VEMAAARAPLLCIGHPHPKKNFFFYTQRLNRDLCEHFFLHTRITAVSIAAALHSIWGAIERCTCAAANLRSIRVAAAPNPGRKAAGTLQ
jgi:hypothetical protein